VGGRGVRVDGISVGSGVAVDVAISSTVEGLQPDKKRMAIKSAENKKFML
jgi:hypothetical protein